MALVIAQLLHIVGHDEGGDGGDAHIRLGDVEQHAVVLGDDLDALGLQEYRTLAEDVLALVQAGNYKRVVLRPLMIVAGDHANNDMAGDEEDSWKSIFEGAGYEVECVLEGLGQLPEIQQLFVKHAQAAIDSVK